jgi:hypothetical protein
MFSAGNAFLIAWATVSPPIPLSNIPMGDVFTFFNAGSWMLDTGFWILDAGFWFLTPASSIQNPDPFREERELPDQMPAFAATDY